MIIQRLSFQQNWQISLSFPSSYLLPMKVFSLLRIFLVTHFQWLMRCPSNDISILLIPVRQIVKNFVFGNSNQIVSSGTSKFWRSRDILSVNGVRCNREFGFQWEICCFIR
jgi:hypothetical protein